MKFTTGLLAIAFGLGCFVAGMVLILPTSGKAPGSETVTESEDVPESEDAAKGSIRPSLGLEYEIVSVKGHDYLFLWNYVRGCCVIHAESCPCKGGAHTN